MLKQGLFRGFNVDVDMKSLGKKIKTKAFFNQKDYKTAMFVFYLEMDGRVLDITDCTVTARFLLAETDERVKIEGKILDAEKGLVAVGLNEQVLSSVGQNFLELVVQYNEQKLYSPQMYFNVIGDVV